MGVSWLLFHFVYWLKVVFNELTIAGNDGNMSKNYIF